MSRPLNRWIRFLRTAPGRHSRAMVTALLVVATAAVGGLGRVAAQRPEERASRAPMLGKIDGSSLRAFSGKVQSVNLEKKLLSLSTVEGEATEVFPIKKDVSVSTATGTKLKIKELKPGSNVIVYYEFHKDGRRTVNEIVVLTLGPREEKKPAPPPS